MAALAVLVALLAIGILLMFNPMPADGQDKDEQNTPVSTELVPEEKTIPATDDEILPSARPRLLNRKPFPLRTRHYRPCKTIHFPADGVLWPRIWTTYTGINFPKDIQGRGPQSLCIKTHIL